MAITRNLVDEEHSGARMMRDMAQREKGIDAGLDRLLFEMMAMDSDSMRACCRSCSSVSRSAPNNLRQPYNLAAAPHGPTLRDPCCSPGRQVTYPMRAPCA